ncbi:MAG: hypothetical protein MI794_14615 [Pseudomonadales bacterium]|nr:hypothetical protein [Pseudomonadales bacterium]
MSKVKVIHDRLLQRCVHSRELVRLPRQQRGASALEYIVLAAALIIIIGVAVNSTAVQTALSDAFSGLFSDAQGGGGT